MKEYVCCVCGRSGVKLWRPYMGTKPLICATCAEKRQTAREYDELVWKEKRDSYIGTMTGKKLPLPKWKVNEKGKVPSYRGPGPKGMQMEETHELLINLNGVSESYSSGETSMVPAVPDAHGDFWGYTSVPSDKCKWWEELPTR